MILIRQITSSRSVKFLITTDLFRMVSVTNYATLMASVFSR